MGDFEELEQLQEGIREWLLRAARNGRGELRGLPASAVLPALCAAAFGRPLSDAAGLANGAAVARIGVLSAVGAGALGEVLADAAGRALAAHPAAQPSRHDLQRELSRSIKQVLAANDARAAGVRSDIAMVLREIDAGGVACRAAIESGSQDTQRDVLAAVETVSAEFGEMAFLLADLARAAAEIQDSLDRQGSEVRATGAQVGRQAADVRMIREELALIEQRARQWVPGQADGKPAGPSWADGCPYRGLLPYGQAHAPVFFGRERLVAQLAGTLAGTGIVIVTGASGAGKTSLLEAGLVPVLARGVQLPGSSCWPVASIRPSARPLAGLADALARLGGREADAVRQALADAPGDAHLLTREIVLAAVDAAQREATGSGAPRLVLIVDQFEEVFAAAGPERAAFVEAVCAAATGPGGTRGEPSALVVISVRGDYWDRCAAWPPLMRAGQLVVGPMTEVELRRVITGPAGAGGLRVEPGLVDAILADLHAAADAEPARLLPLLSQAMMLTWQRREGDLLTRRGYQGTGGLARAVETSAEAAYQALPDEQKEAARDVFRRLTAGGNATPVARDELRAGQPRSRWPLLDAVLVAFAAAGLLVLDADRAGIAHDTVVQAWPRLRGWRESDQASLILYRQLAEDAARWRESGKDHSVLYRGAQLAAARQAARAWEADPALSPALTPGEADFLRASGRAATRRGWRRKTLAGVLVAAVIAALAGAGLAVRSERATATRQTTTEVSELLAAQSTAADATDPVMAALLAAAAWRIAPTAQARYGLLESLAQPVRGILPARSGTVTALAYGPGGRMLAAAGGDGNVQLWDPASHRLMSTATLGATADALAFADGGKVLEAAAAGVIGRWNLTGHARITLRPLGAGPAGGVAAFGPDGTLLATGDQDGNIRLWNAATLQEIGAPMSSDTHPVDSLAFSPDGTMLAAGSSDGNVQLWDTATQAEAGPALTAGSAPVTALAFSPDGSILATGGQDGTARLWDVASGGQDGTAMVTGGPVAALAFGSDGAMLATAGGDGEVELWDTGTQAQTGAPLAAQGSGGVSSLAFSPAGGTLATGGSGVIELWDPTGFHQVSAPLVVGMPSGGHGRAAIAADGGMLAVTGGQRTVRLWDLGTRRPAGAPVSSEGDVTGLALSPDGATLAVVTAGGIQLWATATGRRLGGPLAAAGTAAVAFSPDGKALAAVDADGRVRLWDVATRRQTGSPMRVGAGTTALALGPGGTTLVTADGDGTVRLWDVATGQQIGAPMTAGVGPVYAAAFSPDGTTLVTADGDGTVRLSDVATRQQIGAPMALPLFPEPTQGPQPVYAAAFGPGRQKLVTADGDGTVRTWDVAFPAGLLQAACGIAEHSLTRAQWTDYAGTQPFQQVCPGS
jgi:WD40 repeat protein